MEFDVTECDGACHCGTVRFHARLSKGLHSARRCNCSFCRMRGAIAVSAPSDGFTITANADALTLYQFNTQSAKHWFCSRCGIYTHHQRRSNPGEFGVNVACLEGISPFDFAEVEVMDGVLHPTDDPDRRGPRIVGVLSYRAIANGLA